MSGILKQNWAPWLGGLRPVDGAARVDVMFRNGHRLCAMPALMVDWLQNGSEADVIAYRVIGDFSHVKAGPMTAGEAVMMEGLKNYAGAIQPEPARAYVAVDDLASIKAAFANGSHFAKKPEEPARADIVEAARAEAMEALKRKIASQADDAARKDATISALKGTIKSKQDAIRELADSNARLKREIEGLDAWRKMAFTLANALDAAQNTPAQS